MTLDLSRRGFLGFLAAPAIIRVASLMPVKAWAQPVYGEILWPDIPISGLYRVIVWGHGGEPVVYDLAPGQTSFPATAEMVGRHVSIQHVVRTPSFTRETMVCVDSPLVLRDGDVVSLRSDDPILL